MRLMANQPPPQAFPQEDFHTLRGATKSSQGARKKPKKRLNMSPRPNKKLPKAQAQTHNGLDQNCTRTGLDLTGLEPGLMR